MRQAMDSRLRFGPFELDTTSGELYRDGERLRLQEQPRQVLTALLERPGEVVTREELRERLWKTDTFVDFEHGLNTAIKKVRQALGDSAEQPQYVETLARRGYRFIAPLIPPAAVTPAAVVDTATRTPASRGRTPWIVLVVGVCIVVAAVWMAVRRRDPVPSSGRSSAPAQLAVLPLRVLATSPDADREYLGVGIADAITTRLANARQIALRPTSAVLPYRDAESDPARVAAALRVEHLLVGTIQEVEQAFRVSVQLVRRDGVAVWGRTYDVPRTGLLRLQDDVAEQVVTALRVELTPPERARFVVRHTNNPAAFDHYLRGRALLVNYTEANMREAIRAFEQALALDSNYARARAALATATAWFSVRYAYESEAAAWGKRAEEDARRALALDASLADAHVAIAAAAGTLFRGFDWKTVIAESDAALALDPSVDLGHSTRMRALYHLGRFDEARAAGHAARELNPLPTTEVERLEVAVQLFDGEFESAAQLAAALLARTDAPAVRHYLGLARYYRGDVDGARAMLASAMRGGQPDVRSQASLASIEAAVGLRDAARARARVVANGGYMDHHAAYSLAAAWAQLGDHVAAVKWLQQAADTGFPCYPWFARDSLLDPLRRDPGFIRLMTALESQR
jgi:DNA-binding winged helix-turn-helix (wHTH) protein/TolB-like protein/tetratricopeptide (TPR) repeat protein